eukprot:symbB.v1.2.021701.t2/scaffold1891.1/size97027/6
MFEVNKFQLGKAAREEKLNLATKFEEGLLFLSPRSLTVSATTSSSTRSLISTVLATTSSSTRCDCEIVC